MTLAADLLIRETILSTLDSLQRRPEQLDRIFRGLDSQTLTEIKTYFGADDRITVRLGWVMTSTAMPCIAITQPTDQEAEQYIGSDAGDQWDADGDITSRSAELDDDGVYTEHEVSQFAGSVDAVVYALNAQETTWIATVVKWGLLRQRRNLESHGLDEQRLRLTDFMPASEYPQPDPCYTRAVQVSYTTLVDYDLADPDEAIVLPIADVEAVNTSDL